MPSKITADWHRQNQARLKAEGGRRLPVQLTPEANAALAKLRARGAVSDAAAVNAAVVEMARAVEFVDINHYDKRPKHMTAVELQSLDLEPAGSGLSAEGITGDDLLGFVKHGDRWYRSEF